MSVKEMTRQMRVELANAGIPARCLTKRYCGCEVIHIVPPTAEAQWTLEQGRQVNVIGKANGLTLSQGMEINEEVVSVVEQTFYFWGDRKVAA